MGLRADYCTGLVAPGESATTGALFGLCASGTGSLENAQPIGVVGRALRRIGGCESSL